MRRAWIAYLPAAILIAVGIVCIVIGVMRGEAEGVFAKAINICLECIGIG